jgi:lysophospholipase L1-like esterase
MRKIALLALLVLAPLSTHAIPPGWLKRPVGVCAEGAVSKTCKCGGSRVFSGYCCSGVAQADACTAGQYNFATPGCVASGAAVGTGGEALTFSRASTAYYMDSAGSWQSCASNQLRVGPYGAIFEPPAVQLYPTPLAPAAGTSASLGTGTYSFQVWHEGAWNDGTSTQTVSAGTATTTGLPCTARPIETAGGAAACIFAVTVAGTVTFGAVTGTLTKAQLEANVMPTSWIGDVGASRAAEQGFVAFPVTQQAAWCVRMAVSDSRRFYNPTTTARYPWSAPGGLSDSAYTDLSSGGFQGVQWDSTGKYTAKTIATALPGGQRHDLAFGASSAGTLTLTVDGVNGGSDSGNGGSGKFTATPIRISFGSYGMTGGWWGGALWGVKVYASACPATINRTLVAHGDSITYGAGAGVTNPWPRKVELTLGMPWSAQSWAVNGETSTQVLARWAALGRPGKYGTLLLMSGINDCASDVAAATIEGNLQTMYDQAISDGMHVVAFTLLPWKNYSGYTSGREVVRLAVNTWIRAYAGAHGLALADTAAAEDDGTGALKDDSGDGIHPNQTGTDVIAATAVAAGQAAGFW